MAVFKEIANFFHRHNCHTEF